MLAVTYAGAAGVGARSADETVKLWDIASGKELDGLPGHWFDDDGDGVGPDGKTVAVAGYDRTIQVRDAATGQVLGEIRGLSEPGDGPGHRSGRAAVLRIPGRDRPGLGPPGRETARQPEVTGAGR